jgi:iron complex outermembrane receptor protein
MAAGRLFLSASTGALCLALFAAPASAQRANENAVRSAGDAFGTSVGNERVGIYNPFNARGFSPVQAGNARVEGLYFDFQADLPGRLVAGTTMRVGISAQSYPFSSPTGIADFSLRKAGDEAVLSTVAGYGPFGTLRFEADAQVPVAKGLSVAAGFGVSADELHYGGDGVARSVAVIPRIRPSEKVEILPFVGWFRTSGAEAQPIYFTAGSYLPPEIERRRYSGPSWARGGADGLNYGVIGTARTGGWTLRGGLFRSRLDLERSNNELALRTTPEGVADRFISAEGDRAFASWSGEARASRAVADGDRLHTLHFTLRGREQERRYGGGKLFALGNAPLDRKIEIPEPDFTVGPQTGDQVRQLTFGAGYELRWKDVGEASVSLQRTDYRKEVVAPSGPLPETRDKPWLLNATASVIATPWLTFYGGYARGLEESPVAPAIAVNRDEAPPAILTEQKDAGARIILPGNLRLVAGLFDVRKPYFGLDNALTFRRLGNVRHRGAEFSLSGSPVEGLTAVVGAVFMDARLSGDPVEQGLVGKRPVGSHVRYVNAALDYRIPFAEGLSVDLAFESTSDRVGDRLNSFVIPARSIVSLGGRYRFEIDEAPATLRAQVANIANNYGWNNVGEGFQYNVPRRYSVSLAVDV